MQGVSVAASLKFRLPKKKDEREIRASKSNIQVGMELGAT